MSKKIIGPFFIILFACLIAGLFMFNRWIQGQVGLIVEHPVQNPPARAVSLPQDSPKPLPKRQTGEVLKKMRLAPDRTFEQGIFYQGGQEIARHRITREGDIYDQSGIIPDGKVKFINETDETYGAEIYKDGKRHGPMRAYYNDGIMKQEALYQFGKIVTSKEYFHSGALRMEMDFSDARDYGDGKDVGMGKVYFPNGRVKYEWKLTNTDPIGYQKSYNGQGDLTGVVYFDGAGEVIPPG